MPKGQYPRKPRQPVEAPNPGAFVDTGEKPTVIMGSQPDFIIEREQPFAGGGIAPPIEAKMADVSADKPQWTETEIAHLGGVPSVPAEPAPESFDDWMDEPAPIMPSDDMVSRKVRTWAGSVCAIAHEVQWAPVNDSSTLEVVLTTIHGTARMRKPAGQWSEADVDFALEAMRDDLRV